MNKKIENGDWVLTSTKVEEINGIEEMLSYIKTRLMAKRGKFYPDKNFGSFLHTISDLQSGTSAVSALQFARQALEEMEDVFVKKAAIDNGEITFYIAIKDEEKEVKINL